ncbi:acyltransferase family protein [Agrobacterium vitis]|nr:acyltransferase family protein [Agrobacterium vitis]MUO68385.1 acyltransferase family protein [Agrobacterium vitis]MUO83397.1 acyltransferase family protein [Agrobacterium vitis]MVA34927.1 acyltransferase family protein [Agrobacterium vitis]
MEQAYPARIGPEMNKSQYIQSLDGLRGLAAFAVVLSHMPLLLGISLPALLVGDPSVALFFSLSGFLMAHLYGAKPFTRASVADYLVHRFVRIYPVYLVAVLLVILLSAIPALHYIQPVTGLVEIFRHIAMLGSSGVFWSVPPEIQFYLFFLLLWLCFENPAKRPGLCAAIAGGFAIAMYLGFPGPGIVLLSKIPYFLFGALAGRVFSAGYCRPATALSGLVVLGLIALFFLGQSFYAAANVFWGPSTALIATIIVYLAACEAPLSKAVLASAPLRFAGRISFSLYLFHMSVSFLTLTALRSAFGDTLPGWLCALIMIFASLVAASLSYSMIEKPSRRFFLGLWKARFPASVSEGKTAIPATTQLSS